LILFSGAMLTGADSSQAPEVLSVCDALKVIERLNGKIVTIQGVVGWSQRHGVQAMAQFGLDPYTQSCPGVSRRKRTWPPVLQFASPEDLEQDEAPSKFLARPPTLDDLARALRQREEATGKDTAIATITGEIRTRSNIRIQHRGDDIIGNGYGQAGASPALFIVQTVVNLIDPETRKPLALSTPNPHLAK
jgi:hypothetical protein